MKKIGIIGAALLLWAGAALGEGFTLTSGVTGQFTMTQEYDGFGCKGENTSPALNWENAPKGTKSFAVTLYDPDAPTGSGWWHWVVFNIPASVHGLAENAGKGDDSNLPKGAVQSMTSYGVPGFGGACPPVEDKPHRYVFTVYALDVETLGVDADATPALAGYMLNAHALGKASVMLYYGR